MGASFFFYHIDPLPSVPFERLKCRVQAPSRWRIAREVGVGRVQQEMVLVAHQAVGVGLHAEAIEQVTKEIEKALALAVIREDVATTGATAHHVILPTLEFKSQRAGHFLTIS